MKLYKLMFCFLISISGYTQVSHSVWLGLTQKSNDILGDSSNGSLTYYLGWNLQNTHNLQARLGASLNFDDADESSLSDARLRHRFNFYKNDLWNVRSELRVYLPFSEGSQDNKEFIPRIDYSPIFGYTPKIRNSDLSATFVFKPMYTRNFNKANTVLVEPDNPLSKIQNTIDQALSNQFWVELSYLKFYLEIYFSFQMQWDSTGRRVDDNFATYQDLYYNFNKTFTLMIGHSNGSNLYDERGERQPLTFASRDDSFYLYGIVNF